MDIAFMLLIIRSGPQLNNSLTDDQILLKIVWIDLNFSWDDKFATTNTGQYLKCQRWGCSKIDNTMYKSFINMFQ